MYVKFKVRFLSFSFKVRIIITLVSLCCGGVVASAPVCQSEDPPQFDFVLGAEFFLDIMVHPV